MRPLFADEHFRTLLRAEGIETYPCLPGPVPQVGATSADDATPTKLDPGEVCREAEDVLKDVPVHPRVRLTLGKMSPARQKQAAKLMVAMEQRTYQFLSMVLAVSPPEHLSDLVTRQRLASRGPTREKMRQVSHTLDAAFDAAVQTLASDTYSAILLRGFARRLIANAETLRHLKRRYPKAKKTLVAAAASNG
jgi:hypothetical protein